MTGSGIPPAIRAGHNWMRTAKAGFGMGSFGSPCFSFAHNFMLFYQKTILKQILLATCNKMSYNTTVYTQFSRCAIHLFRTNERK